jgi:protocatechuate 3,4-dioxygenase beta subunit
VHSRLVRAREKLRRGLLRRGVVLSGTAIATALAPRSASASIPPLLCDSTTRAAIAFAARHVAAGGGLSAPAAALAQEVLKTMLIHHLKAAVLPMLLLATVAAVAGSHALSAFAGPREGEPPGEPNVEMARTEPRPPDSPQPAPGRMFVAGRVLDPAGKPVPDATTMVYASLKWPGRGDRLAPMWPSAIGQGRSDGAGRFRLDAPRVSSSRNYDFGAVAIAPGYGAGWALLDPDADQPGADITLRPEQVIRGRLFDVQGRTVRGVAVSVEQMGTIVRGRSDMTLQESEGPYFLPDRADSLPAWPRPGVTDADGRFTIRGAGRGLRLGLVIDDPRFARQKIPIETDAPADTKDLTLAVEPARVITGRLTYADTGQPVPHAVVDVSISGDDGSSAWSGDFETDAQGRFRLNAGAARRYHLSAFPPEREPYLNVSKTLDWPKGAIEHTVDLALPRGVLVRGKVVEEGSGKPIAGARVGYLSNPDRDERTGAWNTRAATAPDGSFQFGVMPAPGYLTVLGPGEDFVLREMGQRLALAGQPGGRRIYSHAFHKLEPKLGGASLEVNITLRPAVTASGLVVDPDGRPVKEAAIISRVVLQPTWISFLFWTAFYRGAVRDGHFAVHGLADDTEIPVYFLDAKHNLGATARLSGQSGSGGPVTVRLQPCGSARARLVDPGGKPVARSRDTYGSQMTMMAVSPGPHRLSQDKAEQGLLAADLDFLARIDPTHYQKGLASDDQGRLILPVLIPSAIYRIYDGTIGDGTSPRLRKEFSVQPGEALDLGDILIERPKS